MLTPDEIERAGDMVAAVYSDIEAKMLDRLVSALVSGNALESKGMTALVLLYQTCATDLQKILDDNKSAIDDATRETVEHYLSLSDKDDISRLGEGQPRWPRQATATMAGVTEILARYNLQMMEGAKQAFLQASTEAITQVNTGALTREQALHRAVRKLEAEGIPIITYQNRETGKVTVRNKVDVAVRRHIRTQIAQDGARMTLDRLNAMDVALVEVSSHAGARPSHAIWQGRCYSLHGAVTIDGVTYPDFYSSTGYGSVSGLLGANCRHSFGPYRHGAPRQYKPDPEHASGLPNDEVYKLEQKQRYLERGIRDAKRELRGAQQLFDADGSTENRANLAKAQAALKSKQSAMRDLIKDANGQAKPGTTVLHRKPYREWAGDMPKKPAKMAAMEQRESLVKIPKERNALTVSPEVNTKAYHDAFEAMPVPKAVSEAAYEQAGRILQKASGTQYEYLVAIDARSGKLLADNLGAKATEGKTGFPDTEAKKVHQAKNGAILIHNHPASGRPSLTDLLTATRESSVKGSIVVGHDSSVWYLSVDNPDIASIIERVYNGNKQAYGDRAAEMSLTQLLKVNEAHKLFDWRRLK